jgi:hypothetical protein
MDRKRESYNALIISCLVLAVVVPLSLYVGGYFALCGFVAHHPGIKIRAYPHEWQVDIFAPLASVEGALTGQEVALGLTPRPIER